MLIRSNRVQKIGNICPRGAHMTDCFLCIQRKQSYREHVLGPYNVRKYERATLWLSICVGEDIRETVMFLTDSIARSPLVELK